MPYICDLNCELYRCVTTDICATDVIITDRQIAHIKDRHPADYILFQKWAESIITEPDYIIEANRPNSAMLLKEIILDGVKCRMILRLKTASDKDGYSNSVITFQRVKEKEWKRLIRNKKVLYKSEFL